MQVQPGDYRERITFKDGIQLIGADRETCRIELTDDGKTAIFIRDCAAGRIENLTIDGRDIAADKDSRQGILLKDSRIVFHLCRIENFRGTGLWAFGAKTRVKVEKSELRNNDCGIMLSSGALAVVQNNLCEKNKAAGIQVAGGKISLNGNSCLDNGGYGIFVTDNSGGGVKDNICEGNQLAGIGVVGKGPSIAVVGNTCRTNHKQGIVIVDGASSNVEANLCDENYVGISVVGDGTESHVMKNTCSKNIKAAVFFGPGTAGAASFNTCERNGAGMVMSGVGAAPVVFQGNKCLNNNGPGIGVGGRRRRCRVGQ